MRVSKREDWMPMQPIGQPNIKKIAVFDLDGTSVDGQSGSLFTRYLVFNGHMSLARALRLGWWGIRYKTHLPYRQAEARELVFGALAGRTADEVDRLMLRFHDEVLAPRYRPMALEEVRRCHEEGLVVLLVSATFEPIARAAAQAMGADGFAATKMLRDDSGNYTGEVDGPVVAGVEKYNAVVKWCDERFGPGGWVLERAYGDHHSDAALLSEARHACAVCPGKTLASAAKRNGWPILDWDA